MRFLCLVVSLLLATTGGLPGEIQKEPFFRSLLGSWEGKGTLTNADGERTQIEEEWSAAFGDDATFAMEGTRQWGDDRQEFRWEYSFNPTSELYECLYWHTGMEEKLRFEVSLTETTVELRAPFGDPGSELLIRNTKKADEISGEVTMTSASGNELLTIEMVHKKKD
ncbi:MAG: hypothetical protein P1U85_01050 [Verrucomicrobiales bacterium]|nr:hypothetical protein [Verrucomicrobiales bacterium]